MLYWFLLFRRSLGRSVGQSVNHGTFNNEWCQGVPFSLAFTNITVSKVCPQYFKSYRGPKVYPEEHLKIDLMLINRQGVKLQLRALEVEMISMKNRTFFCFQVIDLQFDLHIVN